mgnify:CR=1 FL=1
MTYRIAAYRDFIDAPLLAALQARCVLVPAVPGLGVARGLRAQFPTIETDAALGLVAAVARAVAPHLNRVLEQRAVDRDFIDRNTLRLVETVTGRPETVIGLRDASGRVVVGPSGNAPVSVEPVQVPPFLQGDQVTLFGPPDSAKMAVNAMNALHRVPSWEPPLVAELVEASGQVPRWGADDEDSQTPVMERFLQACEHLMKCYDRTLTAPDARSGTVRTIEDSGVSIPIKRIPGLALPDGFHLLDGAPLPLHLVDFVTHVWHNRHRPEALVFYVPKLENEEEAAYLREVIEVTTRAVESADPDVQLPPIQVLCVVENPRAIFRIREMAAALGPHFLGGSLGWHDYLASAARLFQNDPTYRIPVKADPDIVVRHIKASHVRLASEMRSIGGLAIGGMYGVLPLAGDPHSAVVSMAGFIRDVFTQMRRGLDGFWVAHPDFVRTGLALVEASRRYRADPTDATLPDLVRALVPDVAEQRRLLAFIRADDVPGLPDDDPDFGRSLLAANLDTSSVIANHDPKEVRYNVFQALQYLAAWLSGVGCVALPAALGTASGDSVFVRVMDDLATTERSRWELWAEVHHGRVSTTLFEQILAEEVAFIRAGEARGMRRVQVRWEGDAARWYPVAVRVLRQLVRQSPPVEWVTQLLLPFTYEPVRTAADPWATANRLCPGRFVAFSDSGELEP